MKEVDVKVAVIVPTYHAHKTIKRTLCSIASQFGVTYHVYIVVDGEPVGTYDYLLDLFGDLVDISILYKPDNSGPGLARQYAIDHTSEPFLTFIDSDDVLLNCNALVTMYLSFEQEDVMIITPFYKQLDNGQFKLKEVSSLTWMHGKMYRRSFLDKYKIHFNKDYSSSNEDVGFNSMISLITDGVTERIKQLPQQYATYAQLSNMNSITNANNKEFSRTFKSVDGFIHNKLYAFDYAVNRLGILDDGIREAAVRSFGHIWINYVGINHDMPGYADKVNELSKISYKEYAKIYKGLSQQRIDEIELDLIQSVGYSYDDYKAWKDKIINMIEMEAKA